MGKRAMQEIAGHAEKFSKAGQVERDGFGVPFKNFYFILFFFFLRFLNFLLK